MATWKKIITAADDSTHKNESITLAQLDAGLDGESGYGASKILAVNGAGNAIEWVTPTSGDITGITTSEGIHGSSLTGPVPDLVLKLSELSTSTSNADGDHFVVVDDSDAQKKLTKGSIALSGMNNDSGWTDDTAADAAQSTANAALPKAGGAMTGAITTNSTFDGVDVDACNTVANAALPKAGGAMTGAITTNSTFDGVDIATRDGVLSGTTTTANAALPRAGGQMTGNITMLGSQTVDGRDLSADGSKLDGITSSADPTSTVLAALTGDDTLYIGDTGNDATINIRGNLTVTGTTTTVNTTELAIADNQIVLNSDYTGASPTDAGITIERGSKVDSSFFWDESSSAFVMTTTGDYYSDSSNETSLTNYVAALAVQGTEPTRMPSKGSFWYDTDVDTLYVCTDNETPLP